MTLAVLLIACGVSSVLAQGQTQSQRRFDPLGVLPPDSGLQGVPNPFGHQRPEAIPLKMEGGTLVVPVLINGQITLNFTVDSGAAYVSIPADVVSTLIRTGTVHKSDFLGQENSVLADGSNQTISDLFNSLIEGRKPYS